MSKKLKIRILLLIVGGIWGYNLYKTYRNYQAEQSLEESEEMMSSQHNFAPVIFRKDSFELELPNVDPFLKKQSKSSRPERSTEGITENRPKRNPAGKNVVKQVAETKSWPQIKYLGFVKNHSKESALCLLQINGAMKKVSKGDEATGVYVSGVYRDSIQLVFSGECRTFRKG